MMRGGFVGGPSPSCSLLIFALEGLIWRHAER